MSNTVDPMALLNSAQSQGNVSPASITVAQAIMQVPDLSAMFSQALATPDDQIKSRYQTILTLIVDDSTSILNAGMEDVLRDCVNKFIEAQKKGRNAAGILIGIFFINGTVLCPYVPLSEVVMLTKANYQARVPRTPLYDTSSTVLLSVMAEMEKLSLTGAIVRTQTILITDGHDEGSETCSAADVAKAAADLKAKKEQNIVMTVGIGPYDWRSIFTQMGVEPQWILESGVDEKQIRAVLDNASRTSVNAMNGTGAGFTQQAMAGGFNK